MSRIRSSTSFLMLVAAAACSATTSGAAMQSRQADVSVLDSISPARANYVDVIPHVADQRVDVLVGGKPFTAYMWPNSLKKPVLYPLRTASGTTVTRGYPLEPRAGERVDHPHHAGLWFNYGDVNGLDFWNNSTAIKAEDAPKMGTIVHRSVGETKSGPGEGSLKVTTEWIDPQGKPLLRENTTFVFRASDDVRTVDRITTLTALDQPVSFTDNKEGVIGMRVARQLEQPSTTPEKFTDASGRPTTVAVLDNAGVTGKYLSSEGKEGDAVWGTRGRWTTLSGTMNREPVRIAMFDHPTNVGYPTYWHARGYGLFAANPLGQKALSNGKDVLDFKLQPGQSTTFRHEILIMNGPAATRSIEPYYTRWAK
jgi:Methane oxygenase PmoA